MQSTTWNHCFICSSELKTNVKHGAGSCKKRFGTNLHDKPKLAHKILFQYLLSKCQDNKGCNLLVQEIDTLNSTSSISSRDMSNQFSPVQFCSFCDKLGEEVESLHLQLEAIQMKIIDKLKTVKQCVVSNSRLYGCNDTIRLQFEKFEDCLKLQDSSGIDRKFLDLLHQFQTSVFESELQVRNIPLVYLKKYTRADTIPLSGSPSLPVHAETINGSATEVKEEFLSENDDYDNACDSHAFLEYESDTQPEVKDELTIPATETTPHPTPTTKIKKPGRKRKAKKTKAISSLVKKAKVKAEKKVNKESKPSGPARSCSSRTAAAVANNSFKELRNYKQPGHDIITKISSKPVSRKPVHTTEAQKLAKEIRLKQVKNPTELKNRKLKVCEECSFHTKYLPRMEQHLREHEEEDSEQERKYECPECRMTFNRVQYYEFHITHFCGFARWWCDVCNSYIPRQNIKDHIDEHHGGKLYPCNHCEHKFASFPNLVHHGKFHRLGTDSKHDCLECPERKTFSSKVHLLRHLHEYHGHNDLVFKCSYEDCSATFYLESSLVGHVHVHERKFTCQTCETPFGSKYSLEHHIRVNHRKERRLNCTHCDEKFSLKSTLESHLMTAHNVVKYKCEICLKPYTAARRLRIHMLSEHGIGEMLSCKICNRQFCDKRNLDIHVKRHNDNGKRDFFCEVCPFTTTTKTLLKSHMVKHGEKKYACSYCEKSFAIKGYLNDHLKVHTKQKPHQCEVCGAAFSQRGSLNTHKKKHLELNREATSEENYIHASTMEMKPIN